MSSPAVYKPLFIGYSVVSFISPVRQWKVIISGFDLNIGRESKLPHLLVNGRGIPGGLWEAVLRESKEGRILKGKQRNSYKIPTSALQSPLKLTQPTWKEIKLSSTVN